MFFLLALWHFQERNYAFFKIYFCDYSLIFIYFYLEKKAEDISSVPSSDI